MPALNAHLRDPDTHAYLAFHPGCPICHSERLSGTLTSAPLVSQRARAALATGVLAVSTVSPAATFAREPDTARDGTADVTQPAGGDGADRPDGGARDRPQEASDNTPVDEPSLETDDPIIDPDAGPVAQNPRDQPAPLPSTSQLPAAEPAAQATPPTGAASPADAATPADAASPAVPPAPPEVALDSMTASAAVSTQPVLAVRARVPKRTMKARAGANAASQSAAVAQGPGPAPTLLTPSADATTPGDRAHTVRAGESLWSIAGDHLGPGATPAQIAREVHRLWQLNADRIGTGDPDLLMIGTRLRLR